QDLPVAHGMEGPPALAHGRPGARGPASGARRRRGGARHAAPPPPGAQAAPPAQGLPPARGTPPRPRARGGGAWAKGLNARPRTGKRKMAVARVRLALGTGNILVNGRPIEEYFGREVLRTLVKQPLDLVNATTRYDVAASVKGGGPSGQAGALRHGIARALCDIDQGLRPQLKRGGFLTRDARKKERKKYGQRGARARFQFSKR